MAAEVAAVQRDDIVDHHVSMATDGEPRRGVVIEMSDGEIIVVQ